MNTKSLTALSVLALSFICNLSIAADIKMESSYMTKANNGKPSKLYSKENQQNIELTVVTEDEAQDLFKTLAQRDDLPYDYVLDGNYSRAHKMNRILDDQAIISGKVFLTGEFYLRIRDKSVEKWLKNSEKPYEAAGYAGLSYVVAPIILVEENKTISTYVIDPSFFDKAVPYATWKQKMLSHSKSKLEHEYFTTRFCYDLDDVSKNLPDYIDENLADMNHTNRNFSRILFMIKNK